MQNARSCLALTAAASCTRAAKHSAALMLVVVTSLLPSAVVRLLSFVAHECCAFVLLRVCCRQTLSGKCGYQQGVPKHTCTCYCYHALAVAARLLLIYIRCCLTLAPATHLQRLTHFLPHLIPSDAAYAACCCRTLDIMLAK